MEFSRLRILEWVAISFSRGSSQGFPRTHGSNPALFRAVKFIETDSRLVAAKD